MQHIRSKVFSMPRCCLSQGGIVLKLLNREAGFCHRGFPQRILHCIISWISPEI